jgi:hypothetical protein
LSLKICYLGQTALVDKLVVDAEETFTETLFVVAAIELGLGFQTILEVVF